MGLRVSNGREGERQGGGKDKITQYRKTSLLLYSVGTMFACTVTETAVSLSFTPWSKIVTFSLKSQIKCLCLRIRKMYKTFGHNHAEA